MSRKPEEIRATDMTCIALDGYIEHRKKQVDGDKESLAYFDVLRIEAQISNRITNIQTKEDLIPLAEHAKECKDNPSMVWLLKNKFPATFGVLVGGLIFFYVVFHLIEYSIGFDEIVKAFLP